MKKLLFLFLSLCFVPVWAQGDPVQDRTLNIHITATTGESVQDAVITLTNTDLYMDYPGVSLDADGNCTTLVYPGNHHIKVEKTGYNTAEKDFLVTEASTTVDIQLTEAVVTPYALTTELQHDPLTGRNDVLLSWNKEAPAFFDDFEAHDDWSITFSPWTGIDADEQSAAPLQGEYLNRGVLQYAIIVNPLTVNPAWYYQYEVLRAYSGMQYVGFTRTATGEANDDWLITPAVTIGTDNIVRFMAKAGDKYPERFEVRLSTVTDNPTADDFDIVLNEGNYETVTYEDWYRMEYDLSEYAGQTVRIAIRYIADANRYGAFMLMVDDFYVGQREYDIELPTTQARRVNASTRSAANPHETFRLFVGETQVGETDLYSYLFEGLAEGEHTLGVQAHYQNAQSDKATTTITIDNSLYHEVTVRVSTDNGTSADGMRLNLINTDDGTEVALSVIEGEAAALALPQGQYIATLTDRRFEAYEQTVTIAKDTAWDVELKELRITPYNITADITREDGQETCTALIKWNQDLGFYDSFEEYDDFATGEFGGWKSIDKDQMPVYPISLGSTEVQFPGSSNSGDTKPLAPVVFNPSQTTPSMEADGLVAPTHGSKEIMFLNPQSDMVNFTQTDKWLITPQQSIRENYILRLNAAGYDFSETIYVCISTTEAEPEAFTAIRRIQTSYGQENWSIYEIDLSEYAGKSVYVGLHCVSYGGWMCLVDEVYIGPKDDSTADVGNVLEYEVYLDGELKGKPKEAAYTFTGLTPEREYTVSVKAVYATGTSDAGTYTFIAKTTHPSGIDRPQVPQVHILTGEGYMRILTTVPGEAEVYSLTGTLMHRLALTAGSHEVALPAGGYLVRLNGISYKAIVR